VRECYSLTDQRDLVWLAWLTLVTLVLLIAWIPATLLEGGYDWALGVGRVVLLFFVGWYGLRQAMVFVPNLAAGESAGQAAGMPAIVGAEPPATSVDRPAPVSGNSLEPAKYARSGMTDAAAELIAQRLEQRMQGARDYLESDITLAQLAERIGTSPQLLSQYLNHVLGTSFFDYINGLRVAEVQRNLRDRDTAGQSLLQLAFAAGFNSKSTFNTAFKKMTGLAPSTWRAAQVATSEPIR
jgi:AraC-like DNA-binding protein